MNKLVQSLFSIPLTHILLCITLTTILTIFATIEQHLFALVSCYIIFLIYALYKNLTTWVLIALCMNISSLLMITRINYQSSCYKLDQSFLKTNVTIKGFVQQVNHSTLSQNQTTVTINTTQILTKNQSLKTAKKILLFFPTTLAEKIEDEDFITIHNIQLEQPLQQSAYRDYLIKENIWAIGRGTKYNQYELKKHPISLQKKILSLLHQKLKKETTSLFDPLFLGQKEKCVENLHMQHQCTYWGIAHHMARSGAHLAILFGLIMFLLHYARVTYLYRYMLSIFLLLGYALISQPSISFLRALFMIFLHITAKIFKRIPSAIHTLTITTLVTLFYNPMQLYFLDFQLSFGITYVIIWLFNIKNSKTIAFYRHRLVRF